MSSYDFNALTDSNYMGAALEGVLKYFSVILYADLSTERPTGYPALAQLLGGQSAPADCPAGLQGAQQGSFTAS